MNHKQISDLEVGDRLQLREDYVFTVEFGMRQVFTKGSIIIYKHPFLGGFRFEFEVMQSGIFPLYFSMGRSRLLKLKVKKLARCNEGGNNDL